MICVDVLRDLQDDIVSRQVKGLHLMRGCLLFTDNNDVESLNKFAEMIGVSENLFKKSPPLSRYILDEEKRKLAVLNGAKQVSFRDTVLSVRKNITVSSIQIQSARRKRENER